jgi:hypothetical protein
VYIYICIYLFIYLNIIIYIWYTRLYMPLAMEWLKYRLNVYQLEKLCFPWCSHDLSWYSTTVSTRYLSHVIPPYHGHQPSGLT